MLGFVVTWIEALAAECAHLDVIALEARTTIELPNVAVWSLGKERAIGKVGRAIEYFKALRRITSASRPDSILAHMCPIYLNLAYPLAKFEGIRKILWYAHPARNATLVLAERLADAILTSFAGAYPGGSSKVRVIGQGIDIARLTPSPPPQGPLKLLALGRTSASKGLETAVKAMSLLEGNAREATLRIVGPATNARERAYRDWLKLLIDELGLQKTVFIEQAVTHTEVPGLIATASCLVSTTIEGSGDKVVLEAMASGRPVIASNLVYKPLLEGLQVRAWFPDGDATELARRIEDLSAASATERLETGKALRVRVKNDHSVSHWAREVAKVAGGARGHGQAPPKKIGRLRS